jgi:hypothetical protein
MSQKRDDFLMMGCLWMTLAVIVIFNTWNRFYTLPADFLLGALAAWSIGCGMSKFRKADKTENE